MVTPLLEEELDELLDDELLELDDDELEELLLDDELLDELFLLPLSPPPQAVINRHEIRVAQSVVRRVRGIICSNRYECLWGKAITPATNPLLLQIAHNTMNKIAGKFLIRVVLCLVEPGGQGFV